MPRDELGYPLAPEAEAAAAVHGKLWTQLGQQSVAILESGRGISAAELAAELEALDETMPETERVLEVTAVELGQGPQAAYAISASWGWTGTFFVVARNAGHAEVVWDIKTSAAASSAGKGETAQDSELVSWTQLDPSFHEGPLTGIVGSLPAGPEGHARFYVEAESNPETGLERPAQLSVWEWRGGSEVACLFVKSYSTTSSSRTVAVEGDLLKVRIQQRYKTLYTCGNCESPEALWTLRVTPAGVEDLGRVPLIPELSLVDDLLAQIQEGKDTAELASAEARAALVKMMSEAGEYADAPGFVGMLGQVAIDACMDARLVTVETDDLPLGIFTVEDRKAGPYVRAWAPRPASPVDCADFTASR